MHDIVVRCVANNGDGNRNVIVFEPVYQPDAEHAAQGRLTVEVTNTDDEANAGEDFEVGQVYTINVAPGGAGGLGEGEDPFTQAAALEAQAKSIPNSTNTRNYKTPEAQKVPAVHVPDGVVTEPRPAVVLEPVSNTPATAGVVSPPGNAFVSTDAPTPAHAPAPHTTPPTPPAVPRNPARP